MAADRGACIICLDTGPPPIQSGCACRGDSGLAHIACLVRAAASQQARRGIGVWQQCQTCKQDYTGAMRAGLAEAWRSRVAGQAAENDERLAAEYNLASSLMEQGKAVEAEPMLRRLHEVMLRVHGAEDPNTLSVAGYLARSLSNQGKYADAERIQREVLGVQKRVHGAEHPGTLASANNLAGFSQSKANTSRLSRSSAWSIRCKRARSGPSIRTRCWLRAIWLCASQGKANTPTLIGSSARCMRCKSACSGLSIRTR